MSIGSHARNTPDHPALIVSSSGETLTYRELDERSNRLARLLQTQGVRRGDTVALFMENNPRFMEVVWAARRSGLYLTAVNRYLMADEAAYIIDDSDAAVLISSQAMAEVAAALPAKLPRCREFLMVDGRLPVGLLTKPWRPSFQRSAGRGMAGELMLYSSGTTGRPKGVRRPLRDAKVGEDDLLQRVVQGYGFDEDTVYLSPAPMYHAAPLAFSLGVQHAGGTVIMMPHFDAAESLELIQRYRVTHSQWVPTMFVRMLKLPETERRRCDLSSHRCAIHAAAPCPVDVKRAMIDWWGPILEEYYGATEGNGLTRISSSEWLMHPGSVGRAAIGVLHICDEAGNELASGEPGMVYFERDTMPFAYHKDPERTAAAQHLIHPNWSTLGDVGYVDTDGYLYLTDRKAFMIISGGVNIYPREVEDVLISHPAVRDVAVFGIPDPEMGEQVKAVVEVMDGVVPCEALVDGADRLWPRATGALQSAEVGGLRRRIATPAHRETV